MVLGIPVRISLDGIDCIWIVDLLQNTTLALKLERSCKFMTVTPFMLRVQLEHEEKLTMFAKSCDGGSVLSVDWA